ncbi:MAG: hypothetical protein RR382_00635 [Tannerellaceae bacterium]
MNTNHRISESPVTGEQAAVQQIGLFKSIVVRIVTGGRPVSEVVRDLRLKLYYGELKAARLDIKVSEYNLNLISGLRTNRSDERQVNRLRELRAVKQSVRRTRIILELLNA